MKAYNVKLKFNPSSSKEDQEKLLQTFKLHKDIWNEISNYVFEHKMMTDAKILHDKVYYKCLGKFKNSPSQLVIRAIGDVVSTYKTLKTNIRKGLIDADSVESACVKRNLSIRLDSRLCVLGKDFIKLTVVNSPNKRIVCTFDHYEKLKEMMQYSICDPLIFYKEGEFWLSLPFETPEPIHNPNQCVGIDIGLKRFAVTSEGFMIGGKELTKHKRKIRYLKSCLRNKKKANKSKGKKTDSARKHLRKVKRKERNISKNYIHKYTNDILASTNCNTLVIEDLALIKKQNKKKSRGDKNYKYKYVGKRHNNRRSQVPWHDFKTVLTYKANSLGKRVVTVNPAFTSQEDYRNDSDNPVANGDRRGCRYYASDGKVFDADHNASINIARRWGNKNKLPVSFCIPCDGGLRTKRAGSSQRPERLPPKGRQAHVL
jgi:IS605 OrfB family transposase